MKHIIWDFNGTLLNDAQLSVDLELIKIIASILYCSHIF